VIPDVSKGRYGKQERRKAGKWKESIFHGFEKRVWEVLLYLVSLTLRFFGRSTIIQSYYLTNLLAHPVSVWRYVGMGGWFARLFFDNLLEESDFVS